MRTAALWLLALTAISIAPAASAFAVDAQAGAAVAADPATLAPPSDSLPLGGAAPPMDEALTLVEGAQAGALSLDLPAISAQAEASASVAVVTPPTPPAGGNGADASRFVPSNAAAPLLVAAVAVPIAAVAVGVAASTVGLRPLQAGLSAWGARVVRVLLGLMPLGLFSRIERGQLLDNPVRARVHDAVVQDPGLTISDVQARAGIAWGTTVHHLRRLEANGLLVSMTQGAHHRYFAANSAAAAQRSAIAAISHPTARRIATLVAMEPGIDQTRLCQALGLNGPSASKHLGQFREHGLVLSQRVGRHTIHHPTAGLHAALGMLAGPSPTLWASTQPVAPSGMPALVAAQ